MWVKKFPIGKKPPPRVVRNEGRGVPKRKEGRRGPKKKRKKPFVKGGVAVYGFGRTSEKKKKARRVEDGGKEHFLGTKLLLKKKEQPGEEENSGTKSKRNNPATKILGDLRTLTESANLQCTLGEGRGGLALR